MSNMLKRYGHDVLSTDIHDHGYEHLDDVHDFLTTEGVDPAIDMIFTNPPYQIRDKDNKIVSTAYDFVVKALELMKPVNGSVVMLLRHEFDCSSTRKYLFDQPPFAAKFVLTKRLIWLPIEERTNDDNGPRHNYAIDREFPECVLPSVFQRPAISEGMLDGQ